MAKPVDNSVRESAFASASEPPIPRHSGFLHPTGLQRPSGIAKANGIAKVRLAEQANDVSVADAIRSANVTLEQESAQHLSIPLSLALEQRDHYITEWCREREMRQQDAARVTALLDEQRKRHQAELDVLREQLRDVERELASVRPEPRTIIGVAPAKRASGEVAPVVHEDASLRASLEAAWLDVEDARSRLAATEVERDQAIKEADDLRVELYDKLAAARDEVIEAENRLTELQRVFDDAKDLWEDELARLRSEVEEVNHAIVPPPLDPAPLTAPPTLSALLGFEPAPELDSEPPDSQGAEAAIGPRSKGFGLRRLFRSSKP